MTRQPHIARYTHMKLTPPFIDEGPFNHDIWPSFMTYGAKLKLDDMLAEAYQLIQSANLKASLGDDIGARVAMYDATQINKAISKQIAQARALHLARGKQQPRRVQ